MQKEQQQQQQQQQLAPKWQSQYLPIARHSKAAATPTANRIIRFHLAPPTTAKCV